MTERRAGPAMACALLFVCILFGGGGPHAPFALAVTQIASLPVLMLFCVPASDRPATAPFAGGSALLALILIAVVLQLIQLPVAIWSALDGRDPLLQAMRITSGDVRAHSLSLDPQSSRRAAMALLPGAAMFVATAQLGLAGRARLALVLVLGAVAAALVGGVQALQGVQTGLRFFPTSTDGLAIGFFANRNHQADLMLTAIAMLPVLVAATASWRQRRTIRWTLLAVGILLAAGLAGTVSRTGAVLFLPVLVAVALMLWTAEEMPPVQRRRALAIAAAVAVAFAIALTGELLPRLMTRFSLEDDRRYQFWPDVIYAIHQYFPAGSGLGTFDLVFRSVERLDIVESTYVNHAHNDYLELLLEFGAAAPILLLLFLAWLARPAVHAVRGHRQPLATTQARAGLCAIVVVMAHSVTDYPLRTETLMAVFGFACGLLCPPPPSPAGASAGRRSRGPHAPRRGLTVEHAPVRPLRGDRAG